MNTRTLNNASQTDMNMLQRFCRGQIFKQLLGLKNARLLIIEGEQQFAFGDPHANLHASIIVQDADIYPHLALGGSLGAAEAYMTGDWQTPDLTALIRVMARNIDLTNQVDDSFLNLFIKPLNWLWHLRNRNTNKGSKRNIAAHYDLGNNLFEAFLDPSLMYSAGIFPTEDASMEEASLHKLERICQKLDLQPTDHLVEIGSGWGSMAIYAAKHFGCHVTTTTISEQQYALTAARIAQHGLQDKITLLKEDYRNLSGKYNKLVSIEMIEAVGHQFYPEYFATLNRLLSDDGIALIQAITISDQRYARAKNNVDFIQRYIFPGSCIPSVQALQNAMTDNSQLRLVHLEDITGHYARTLHAWRKTFHAKKSEIADMGYDETFLRMWDFYFAYCEGGFAERIIGDVHLMYAKPGFHGQPPLGVINASCPAYRAI
jgi:cyclopropane-fatty-acyl-phospholipid synthase